MPIGGKLVLKGGETLSDKKIKKKKKSKKVDVPEEEEAPNTEQGTEQDQGKPKKTDAKGISIQSGKTYEEEFEFETQRMKEAKGKSTPWGSSHRTAPEILHGYTQKVTGATASERLDMRAATKSDRYAK
eukprot:CAMPEP_0202900738 /NCGR_PEP_ID=MMETSP1392-20130828/12008_1 /ASSEMBLY_ACC=CAM_ASM_000868 /TAXON_ID=225041 /ORGANISM="Chlamydomonas chlamydogama, Strain SAG 11-48b" /LENGTH=128 /DNA_ID=CAMNT_0049587177 /DNA_START=74 /DNA_END=460 /DNA_ORIENTATION=+